MFDERAFRKAVEVVEGKLSRHEYLDYNHGCGMHCVVAKALQEITGKGLWGFEANNFVTDARNAEVDKLWSAKGMGALTRNQDSGAAKCRAYLKATKELVDA